MSDGHDLSRSWGWATGLGENVEQHPFRRSDRINSRLNHLAHHDNPAGVLRDENAYVRRCQEVAFLQGIFNRRLSLLDIQTCDVHIVYQWQVGLAVTGYPHLLRKVRRAEYRNVQR